MEFTTPHLCIRRFRPDDWKAVHAYASDPLVMAYMMERPFSEDQARDFVQRHSQEDAAVWAVALSDCDFVIGEIVFHPWVMPRTYEIGWVFHPAYQGMGYATEAAHELLRYGFETLQLHRIIATCQPENIASWRVMEKLGMRREGFFQKCIPREGNIWWDEYFYALLEEEWAG